MFLDRNGAKVRPGAFTLIETLAVVMVLSMVATAGLWSLSRAGDSARIREVAFAVREADAFARLQARRGTAIELRINEARLVVTRGSEELLSRSWPPDASVQLVPIAMLPDGTPSLGSEASTPMESIQFDRAGRSIDFRVLVRGAATSIALLVSGVTGSVEIVRPRQEPNREWTP